MLINYPTICSAIYKMKNLPNKLAMDKLPRGEADKSMETMTPEELQGIIVYNL